MTEGNIVETSTVAVKDQTIKEKLLQLYPLPNDEEFPNELNQVRYNPLNHQKIEQVLQNCNSKQLASIINTQAIADQIR